MGLIADKIIPQLVIDKMIEVFGESNIISASQHYPKTFDYQIKLAKWLVNLDNLTTSNNIKEENDSETGKTVS